MKSETGALGVGDEVFIEWSLRDFPILFKRSGLFLVGDELSSVRQRGTIG